MQCRILLLLAFATAAGAQTSVIRTIAGGGVPSGAATNWGINYPQKVAVDSSGNLYIAVSGANQVWVVNSSGNITQVIGNGSSGYSGDGGPASSARLFGPGGVAVDSQGNIFIADTYNNRIRKVASGVITTIAGNGTFGDSGDGGTAINATVGQPTGITVDSHGNVYFVDNYYYYYYAFPRIRGISTAGYIITVAGSTAGFSGDGGSTTSAQLSPNPGGIAVDSNGSLYIADTHNCRIREVSGGIINTVAGNGACAYSGDGGNATAASLNLPGDVMVDTGGNLYISDSENNRIRKVAGGVITSIAGNGTDSYGGDGGPATAAEMSQPSGVAVDSGGNLFIADPGNNRVREVSAGIMNTVAGNGTLQAGGDGGIATNARLSYPEKVAVDSSGNVYIADTNNNQIRKVSAGVITTIAGNGTSGYSGDGGAATSAQLSNPYGIALDSSGNLYIADAFNCVIREVSGGIITTIAGTGPAVTTAMERQQPAPS